MNETWLRWKGRIGASKLFALIIGILVVVILVGIAGNLYKALKNLSGLEPVSVNDLVTNKIGNDSYISVNGMASFQLSYEETNNGVLQAIIYPLIDLKSHNVIFVRSTNTGLASSEDQLVTVSGMTQSTPSDLQNLIAKDVSDIEAAGFKTSTTLYVLEGEKPGDISAIGLETLTLAAVLLLCVATFFFPSTVFHPQPVQPQAQVVQGKNGVKIIGRLQRLKSVAPELVFGYGTRKFRNAVANIFTSKEGWLGIYIHYIFTYRVEFIPVYKQITDWAVVVLPTQVLAIEPGKLYGWRDHPAVSIKYRDATNKAETLIVSFEHNGAQAQFVEYLRGKGYAVSTSQFSPVVPTWSS